MLSPYEELIHRAYSAFNARDIDSVLSTMHPGVEWPKAFEGIYVTGPDAIREYWTKQWSEIDPNVEPKEFSLREDGRLQVLVHQVVKDLQGSVLLDAMVKHIYTLRDGLLSRMDMEPA